MTTFAEADEAGIRERNADPWNERVTRHRREQDGVADRRLCLQEIDRLRAVMASRLSA